MLDKDYKWPIGIESQINRSINRIFRLGFGGRPWRPDYIRRWLENRKDLKNGIFLGADNCQLNSKIDSDTGKILFTGFTNSSGIQEVLKIISHSSGFRPISMDKAGVDCVANETLFVHSTLPNSISRCSIRDTVIMLCNPQEIIRKSDKTFNLKWNRPDSNFYLVKDENIWTLFRHRFSRSTRVGTHLLINMWTYGENISENGLIELRWVFIWSVVESFECSNHL